MKFCTVCDNMYYLKTSEDGESIMHYCKFCGHEDTEISDNGMSIIKTNILKKDNVYSDSVNKYSKNDPTLPKITTIRCPNADCKSNVEEEIKRDIVYYRYNDSGKKYIYICKVCDTVWKTNDKR